MAEPYDVLASLNRMLESEERREQYKLQSSLALMQFAQEKRMQDIQLAGQRLELLQAANAQMMGSQAQSFLTESGLDTLYLSTFDEDEPDESVSSMTKKLTKGDWGFSPEEASRIVGAVYASKAGNHSGIMKIGNDVSLAIQFGESASPAQISLFNKFSKSSPSLSEDRVSQMSKTMSNQSQILKEMFDFGQGDYDISPDIGMDDLMQASDDEITEALEGASGEIDDAISGKGLKSMVTQKTLSQDIADYDKQIEDLGKQISGEYEDLVNLENQKRLITSKQYSGLQLSEEEQNFLNTSRELKSLGEAEIQNLNKQIDDLKKEQSKYKIAKFTAEPIPGTQLVKGTLLDDEEYRIRGVGGMSGRLY